MKTVQILGTGCPKCQKLAQHAEQAIRELGIEARIEKIERIGDIVSYGVMTTPALAVDGVVKSAGKLLQPEDIKRIIA